MSMTMMVRNRLGHWSLICQADVLDDVTVFVSRIRNEKNTFWQDNGHSALTPLALGNEIQPRSLAYCSRVRLSQTAPLPMEIPCSIA